MVGTVPCQVLIGVNETIPVTGSTVKVPFPGISSVVFVQSGATSAVTGGFAFGSAIPQSFTDFGSNGTDATPGVSFPNGFTVWTTLIALADESGFVTGRGGSVTVTVIVEFTVWPALFVA
jgi:hypothetical protein